MNLSMLCGSTSLPASSSGSRRSFLHRIQQVSDLPLIARDHSLEHRTARPRSARDQDLLENRGSGGDHMRLFGEPIHQRRPVLDAVVGNALQADVGSGAQQALLQVLAKAIGDRHRDYERGHARGNANDGNAGDDADEGLPSFGAQVAGRDEEFEAHEEAISRQLSAFSQTDYNDCPESGPA